MSHKNIRTKSGNCFDVWFGVKTFENVLESILTSKNFSIDVLLMAREEVCTVFSSSNIVADLFLSTLSDIR